MKLMHILIVPLLVLGVILSIFRIMHGCNVISMGVVVAVLIIVKCCSGHIAGVSSWIVRHEALSVFLIVLIGIVLRMALAILYDDYYWRNPEPVYTPWNDSYVIVAQARQFAAGQMPETKSWGTILFYGGLLKVLGNNIRILVAATIVIDLATSVGVYFATKKWFGATAGVVAGVLVCWSPTLVYFSFRLLTEHLYFFFVVMAIVLMQRATDCGRRTFPIAIVVVSAVIWMATWTRSEGVVLWVALLVPVCSKLIFQKRYLRAVTGVFLAALMFGLGAVFAISVHRGGDQGIFSSNDSWWPRLHGACREKHGRFGGGRAEVARKFETRYPGRKFHYELGMCPKEAVPIIREEIARRWKSMTKLEMVMFIIEKEIWDWSGFGVDFRMKSFATRCFAYFANHAIPLLVSLLALLSFLYFLRNGCDIETLAPLLIVAGVAAVLAITESLPRYGMIMEVLFPIYAAKGMQCFQRRTVG